MDRLEELRTWFETAPMGEKFPMRIDGLGYGFAEVSMDIQMGYLVPAGKKMIMQGGILAVLANAAAVLASMSALASGHTPLAHISYDLLSPTTLVDFRLLARAKILTQSKRWIWVEVSVYGMSLSPNGDNLKAVVSARFAKPKQACLP